MMERDQDSKDTIISLNIITIKSTYVIGLRDISIYKRCVTAAGKIV